MSGVPQKGIISDMKALELHSWEMTIPQAQEVQKRLASQVSRESEVGDPHLVAGVDISAPDASGVARGAVVVLRCPGLSIVEAEIAEEKVKFPYIPGLLSFREAPLIIAACERLKSTPELIMVDGQGIAHPRRMGLASHVGLFLDTPTIGCAKSILCGRHGELGEGVGSCSELIDNGEVIGAALRTKAGIKPIYVSIGHKVDLPTAISWVMACLKGYRLPEPTRLAHLAAAGKLEVGQGEQRRLFT